MFEKHNIPIFDILYSPRITRERSLHQAAREAVICKPMLMQAAALSAAGERILLKQTNIMKAIVSFTDPHSLPLNRCVQRRPCEVDSGVVSRL